MTRSRDRFEVACDFAQGLDAEMAKERAEKEAERAGDLDGIGAALSNMANSARERNLS